MILLIVTFLWRRSESIARPAFIRADEKGGNSVKSRTQKLQGQDGILLDGDEVESRMRQGRLQRDPLDKITFCPSFVSTQVNISR